MTNWIELSITFIRANGWIFRHKINRGTVKTEKRFMPIHRIYDSMIVCLRITWLKKRDKYLLRTVNVMRTPYSQWNRDRRPLILAIFISTHSLSFGRFEKEIENGETKKKCIWIHITLRSDREQKENLDSNFSVLLLFFFFFFLFKLFQPHTDTLENTFEYYESFEHFHAACGILE